MKTFISFSRAAFAPAILTVALLLTGCGGDSPEKLVASAKQYLAKKEIRSAAIQLRNALQKAPENGEARFLYGSTLLDAGDPVSAEKELRRALQYGYSPEAIYPLLARALLDQGAPDKVITELKDKQLSSPAAQAELLGLVGEAYLRTRRLEDARVVYQAAARAKSDSPWAQLGQARIKVLDRDPSSALAITNKILTTSPDFVDALILQGELLAAKGDSAGAVTAYEKVLAVQPSNIAAHYSRVVLLTRMREFDKATAALGEMKKVAAKHPRTLFVQGLLAVSEGKPADAREPLGEILRISPNHLPTLLLAGSAEYQLRSYARAEDHLRKALTIAPEIPYTRRLLTETYLRDGHPQEALETFEPLLKTMGDDPRLLSLAGEVYLWNNNPERAAEFFQKAVSVDPKDAAARTRLGQMRLVTGDADKAIQDLEAASAEGPHQIEADLALIANFLRNRDYDKALDAARKLQAKQPDNPLASNLIGAVYLSKRDLAGARKAFEQALAIKSDYAPSLYNLARLDLAEKKPDQVKRRYDAILAKDPNNEVALLGLADLLLATQAPRNEVAATLERAVSGNPQSSRARVALIRFHLQGRDFRSALSAAQQAQAALPDNLQILDLLGVAQLGSGDPNQAIATFNKLAALAPKSPEPLVRIASVHLAQKDVPGALQSLRRALALNPNLVEVRQEIATLSLREGKPDDALAEAKEVQKRFSTQPIGYLMEGDIQVAQKKWPAAVTAYREALKRGESTAAAARLHGALEQAGRPGDADAFARKWLKDHPHDTAFPLYLADLNLRKKEYANAASYYRVVLATQPDNPVALNNLAYVAAELKDPNAIKYAEHALSLAPENPAIQDTLGWLLVEKGEVARGLELLKKAATRAPNTPEIRLHLAKALIKTGDRNAARGELEAVMKLDRQPAARAEAERLLATL